MLLKSEQTQWKIICCTGSPERENELECACRRYSNYIDIPVELVQFGLKERRINYEKLREKLMPERGKHDIVLTHNSQGEYGNPDHILVHCFVINTICNPNTWVFISPGSSNVNQNPLKSKIVGGNRTIEISQEILNIKTKIFHECHKSQAISYGYDDNGILRESHLRETLSWEFDSGKEVYTFYK